MKKGIVLLSGIVLPLVLAFSTVACSKSNKNVSVSETEISSEETSTTLLQESSERESETESLTSATINQKEETKVETSTDTTTGNSIEETTVPETPAPTKAKEENISHEQTKVTEPKTQIQKVTAESKEQKETKASKPTEKVGEDKPTEKVTSVDVTTTKAETPTKKAEPITTAEEPTTAAKSIYDYPFDVDAIKREMISWGESMGLEHWVYDGDRLITPEHYSWGVPTYGTKTYSGKRLERQLKDMVFSAPELIEAYGGGKITWFSIYIETDEKGTATFYYIY